MSGHADQEQALGSDPDTLATRAALVTLLREAGRFDAVTCASEALLPNLEAGARPRPPRHPCHLGQQRGEKEQRLVHEHCRRSHAPEAAQLPLHPTRPKDFLEPCAAKVARTVLRGTRCSNAPALLDRDVRPVKVQHEPPGAAGAPSKGSPNNRNRTERTPMS